MKNHNFLEINALPNSSITDMILVLVSPCRHPNLFCPGRFTRSYMLSWKYIYTYFQAFSFHFAFALYPMCVLFLLTSQTWTWWNGSSLYDEIAQLSHKYTPCPQSTQQKSAFSAWHRTHTTSVGWALASMAVVTSDSRSADQESRSFSVLSLYDGCAFLFRKADSTFTFNQQWHKNRHYWNIMNSKSFFI